MEIVATFKAHATSRRVGALLHCHGHRVRGYTLYPTILGFHRAQVIAHDFLILCDEHQALNLSLSN